MITTGGDIYDPLLEMVTPFDQLGAAIFKPNIHPPRFGISMVRPVCGRVSSLLGIQARLLDIFWGLCGFRVIERSRIVG